jgi:hypothetical protein
MKKYLVVGTVLVALAAVCLFSFWESASSGGNPLAFYGTATNGRTVTAFKQPGNIPY